MSQRNITRRAMAGGLAAGVGLLPYGIGVSNAQPAQKTFLLVHGTFAGGWCWRRVADLLESRVTRFSHQLSRDWASVPIWPAKISISIHMSPTSSTSSMGRP